MTEAQGLRLIRRRLPAAYARGFNALHRVNRRLWELHDRVRQVEAATSIARFKREIDEANHARHAAVTAIDRTVLERHRRGAALGDRGAVIDSSSIGHLLDRLSILVLKRARVAGPTAHGLATAQWEHAFACLDRALTGLAAGRWVHHPAGEVKQYGVRRAATRRSAAGRRSRRAGPTAG